MKKWFLLIMAMTLTTFRVYADIVTVESPRDGFLALRSEPSVKSGARLARIPHATVLELGECRRKADDDTWCRTSYQGMTGWVSRRYVISQHAAGSKAERAAGSWRIGPESFGPITFGMAQAEAERLLGQKLEHNDSWSDDCFFSQVSVPGGAASLQVKDRRVIVAVVDQHHLSSKGSGGIATSRGISVGDTLAQVEKAYVGLPGFKKEFDDGGEFDYPAVVFWDSRGDRGILFEYDRSKQRVWGIRAGTNSIHARHEGCD